MKKLLFFIFLIIPFSYAEDLKGIFLAKELITLDAFDQKSDAILVKKK